MELTKVGAETASWGNMRDGLSDRKARQYLRAVFDIMPLPAFIVREDVLVQDFNKAAARFLGPSPELALERRGGEALHCLHAKGKECGRSAPCQDCVIRQCVNRALGGSATHRQLHRAELEGEEGSKRIDLLVSALPLPGNDVPQALLVLEDVGDLLALRDLVPDCGQAPSVPGDPAILAPDWDRP